MASNSCDVRPTSKELLKVAKLIDADKMMHIAIGYLDFDRHHVLNSYANALSKPNPVLVHHIDMLDQWVKRAGRNGTRENLHRRLTSASEKDGLCDRSAFDFLVDPLADVSADGTASVLQSLIPTPGPINQEQPLDHLGATRTPQRSMTMPLGARPKHPADYNRSISEALTGSLRVDLPPSQSASVVEDNQGLGTVNSKLYELGNSEAAADNVQIYQSKEVLVTNDFTFSTDLAAWEGTTLCRMTNGNTVIFGKKPVDPDGKGPGIYIYNPDGLKTKRLEDVCIHRETKQGDFISMKIDASEYVVVLCEHCRKFFLLNVENGKFYSSYEAAVDLNFGPFCQGEEKELCLVVKKSEQVPTQSILILNCSRRRFSQKNTIDTEVKTDMAAMSYLASTKCLIMREREGNRIVAISCETGEQKWQLDDQVYGQSLVPKCLATFSQLRQMGSFDSILIVDSLDRLLSFSSQDGKFKHAVKQNKLKNVMKIYSSGEYLIAQQVGGNDTVSVRVLKMSYEFESSV